MAFGDFQLREEHFVVIDNHADKIKAGIANPFGLPAIVLEAKVGITSGTETSKQYIVGKSLTEALADPQNKLTVVYPLEGRHPTDWEALTALWFGFGSAHQILSRKSIIFEHLQIQKTRNHSPVLVTVPSHWSREDRERCVHIFFEQFFVPGIYVADAALMRLYGYGQSINGLVIDITTDRTDVVTVYEAAVQNTLTIPIGGKLISENLKKQLDADATFKREFGGPVHHEALQYILENVCEAAFTPIDYENKSRRELARTQVFFGDQKFTVGEERIRPVEMLFAPKIAGVSAIGLGEAIYEAIMKCEVEKRKSILENVIITGSFSYFKGLKQRIEKEIKSLLPVTDFANDAQAREVRFGRFPEYIEALKDQTQEASWLGASITAKMIFVDMKNFITKLDYNDIGPRVVSLKGY